MSIEKLFENSDALLTPDEVSTLLRIPKKTLYQWTYRGEIPFQKLGGRLLRFRAKEIEQWLQNQQE